MAAANKLAVLSRSLSSRTQSVKPPIQVFGLEGRYATSLYSAASKLKQLDQVEKDLNALQGALKTSTSLRTAITSPIINKKLMANTLNKAAGELKLAPATANLLGLLAENRRLKNIDSVINAFKIIMAAHRGEVVCEVVTAKPLDSSQTKQLESALRAFLKGNQQLKITSRVDPSIIGGLIVSIGDKYVDMSIASKVKLYTDVITSSA
ncbi:PREDICTED: ATP synthase subunit O, mitochondrial isoform X2 [Rhagoletis zephyria]|uniref:ATP synthase subunit O, mitochondrial isoform X1 n=1 Tax=Rhagoletis zephyria TaxID=28612 RepID=UPI00081193D6|nr:PREDICTED: ATP synthase subunit O, mitochondrial isoform X1 [Rhagoletis zephyria]XP_017490805.1 PREDICTED: ATP synthase subunit O, mitochondrial isoform X2 [Rhagoletis zephyria]